MALDIEIKKASYKEMTIGKAEFHLMLGLEIDDFVKEHDGQAISEEIMNKLYFNVTEKFGRYFREQS